MEEKPSYYAIIPANVRYSQKLKANEKLLYGEITALTQATGKCWAGNSYFSKIYNVSVRSISEWISNLNKEGYINIQVNKNDNGTFTRVITLRGVEENFQGGRRKLLGGIEENFYKNNTSNNNKYNNMYGKNLPPLKSQSYKNNTYSDDIELNELFEN